MGKGLSRTSVRHIANQLHLALEHALRRGLIARNPADQTDPPARDTKPTITLTTAQLAQYLADATETAPPNLAGVYWTIAVTGCRLGEALGLREIDLDLDAGVLFIRQTLKQSGRVGKPKTERSRRTVTLPPEVVDALRKVRKWKVEQKLRLGPKFRDCGLIFCTPRGRPLHQNNIRRRDFYPRLDRLELPKVRLHDLRHGHGTDLIAAGVDPRTVADRLGHSSPAFTMSVYVHAVSESQRRAAAVASTLPVPSKGLTQEAGG